MTLTRPGADMRGYYHALGIELPDWARTEASVRCFADPDAHRRGDRDPSCSVNLEHGAWHCHGCGAKGGAFDAATARGYSDRAAIDLMVTYGITEHRLHTPRNINVRSRSASTSARPAKPSRRPLRPTGDEIDRWEAALAANADLIAKLGRDRGWRYTTMLELELGLDRRRITIPVRDHDRQLIGLLRYQPWPKTGEPKMLATAASRRALLPHPAAEPSSHVLLVEGEPDMIAARSRGLPAIAVPGVDSWRREWVPLFSGRTVTIVADADRAGRMLAAQIKRDLAERADVLVADLAPHRRDGYDLTNWLREHPTATGIACVNSVATTNGVVEGRNQ
jgi:CheY-like chemotaxis protein